MRIINKREFAHHDRDHVDDLFGVVDLPRIMDRLAARRVRWMLARQCEREAQKNGERE